MNKKRYGKIYKRGQNFHRERFGARQDYSCYCNHNIKLENIDSNHLNVALKISINPSRDDKYKRILKASNNGTAQVGMSQGVQV